MSKDALAASPGLRHITGFFAAVFLALVCSGVSPVSAAECGPQCDLDVLPSLPSDQRCLPREIVPKSKSTPFPAFEREGPRCDLREPKKEARQHPPAAPSQTTAPVTGKAAVTGAGDPGRLQARNVDRDAGFDDVFGTTPTSAAPGTVHGASAASSIGATAGNARAPRR